MPQRSNSHGFTILELLIATVIFSLVLLVCLASFLQIGRLFTKGVNMSLTQQDARDILTNIGNDIRFSQNPPTIANGYFCVGLHRYKYMLNNHLKSDNWDQLSNYGLVRENVVAGCPSPAVAGSGTQPVEMIDNGMQLNRLTFGPSSNACSSSLCTISINLLFYGVDNAVFTSSAHPGNTQADHAAAASDPDATCTGSLEGSQFCATANYTTTVLQSF